jgi:hypothetical protein
MSRYAAYAGVIVFALGMASSARAGLYSTADSVADTRLDSDFVRVFSRTLGDLRSIGADKPERESTLRKRYILMEIGNKGGFDLQTLEEKLNYSVVLIRRNRADDAIVLLTPLTRQYTDNLLLHSHFATAHFLSQNPADRDKASGLMKDCLSMWPEKWEALDPERQAYYLKWGWGEGIFEQNRKYEVYLHKLMQYRRKPANELSIDPLFGPKDKPVRFSADAGRYAAGRIPATERDKLPGDAIEIVEQLLVWMPNDPQLYWLLGEVFNASAMNKKKEEDKYDCIKAAYLILKEIKSGMRQKDVPKELDEHYAVLKHYIDTTDPPTPSSPALDKFVDQFNKDNDDNKLSSEQWWRPLIVAFLSGLALGLFTLWQYQEMRRRRQARA